MNAEKLKHLPEIVVLTVLLIISGCFFGLTNPSEVPSVVLIVGFGLLFGCIYVGLRLVARLAGLKSKLSKVQHKTLTLGGALLPTLLLALQSIGQLTVRDVITIVAIFVAGCFYIMKLAPKTS